MSPKPATGAVNGGNARTRRWRRTDRRQTVWGLVGPLLFVTALLASSLPAAALHSIEAADALQSGPVFTVDPGTDEVWGEGWAGESVTITVGTKKPVTVGTPQLSEGSFTFEAAYDIKAGQTVNVSDGSTPKTHTVTALAISSVDTTTGTVTGTAAKSTPVTVTLDTGESTTVTASSRGAWTATLPSINADDQVHATQTDTDGDTTHRSMTAPPLPLTPTFTVDPDTDTLTGTGWPASITLTVTLSDATLGTPTADDQGAFTLESTTDLTAGSSLTVTGGGYTKTHTVTALAISSVDTTTGTVTGTAAKSTPVTVTLDTGESTTVTASSQGAWTATLPSINADDQVHATQTDTDGDTTHRSMTAPPLPLTPTFTVDPDTDTLTGTGWPASITLTVTLSDATLGTPTADDQGAFTLESTTDLTAGSSLTVTGGGYTKTHTVTALAISSVDTTTGTVTGTAAKSTPVTVTLDTGESTTVTASSQGAWTATLPSINADDQVHATQTDTDGDTTHRSMTAPPLPLTPTFTVDPDTDTLTGTGWPASITLTVTLSDATLGTPTADDQGAFTLESTTDLTAGSSLTVTGGGYTKTHTVTALAISSVDTTTGTVTGTAAKSTPVTVTLDTGESTTVTASSQGAWTATLPSINADDQVHATQTDTDGDTTHRSMTAPPLPLTPTFTVDPDTDTLTGTGWPASITLTVTLSDATLGTPTADDQGAFTLESTTDLTAGSSLTVTGGGYTKTHTVTALAISSVDTTTGTVTGTAAKSTPVTVTLDTGESTTVTASSQGAWTATLPSINADDQVHATQTDTDGDTTHRSMTAPPLPNSARFSVDAGWEDYATMLWGDGWAPNGTVTITVSDGTTGHTFEATTNSQGGFWAETFSWGLRSGHIVTVTDGITTKDHTVTALTVTGVDAATETVSGTAAQSSQVTVAINGGPVRTVTADNKGNWVAILDYDLIVGTRGIATQADDDGDASLVTWEVPYHGNPNFMVDPTTDSLMGWGWQPDSPLTISVNGADYPSGTSSSGEFWYMPDTDIGPGDKITVSDGVSSSPPLAELSPYVVTGVTITGVDADADTVAGTAEPGTTVHMFLGLHRWPSRTVTADAEGVWLADFSTASGLDADGAAIDIDESIDGAAAQYESASATDGWYAATWAQIRYPSLNVDPGINAIWGSDWPANSYLTITVNGAELDPVTTDRRGDYWVDVMNLDVTSGDVVLVTDGAVTKSHTVTALAITSIDTENDTVSGTTDSPPGPGRIMVQVYLEYDALTRFADIESDGTWVADFSDSPDGIRPGTSGAVFDNEGGDDGTTVLNWWAPNPAFSVNAEGNAVWGWEWAPGEVSITVNDGSAGAVPTDEWGNFGTDALGVDIIPGDTVTVTDGTTTKTHTVTALAITSVDPDTSTVTGTTDSTDGSLVEVHLNGPDGWRLRSVQVTGGVWTADFATPVDDDGEGWGDTATLSPGTQINAEELDPDGDRTNAGYSIPNPAFSVNAEGNAVWGWEWAPGEVSITVNDGSAGTVPTDEWGNFGTDALGVDIIPGDTVTVTDGTTTKTHTVTALAITSVDPDTSTVTGTTDSADGSLVEVHLNGPDGWRLRSVQVTGGVWTADFATPVDDDGEGWGDTATLSPGTQINAEELDPDGDRTNAGYSIPNPAFSVNAEGNAVWGWEWAPGEVSITVNDGSPGTVPTDEWGNFGTDALGVDIIPGDTVTVTDGTTTKTHTVTALAITSVDPDTSTVTGTTDSADGSLVEVHLNGPDGWRLRSVQVTGGTWTADFATPVDDDGEGWGDTATLSPGTQINAEELDPDGDRTNAGYSIPNPHFNVDAQNNGVWGHEWQPSTTLTVTINGGNYQTTSDEWGNFDLPGHGVDIQAGDTVTVTDGTTTKEHIVSTLTMVVDAQNDIVTGSTNSPPGTRIHVHLDGPDGWRIRDPIVAEDGTWTADFTTTIDDGGQGWGQTADIGPGTRISAQDPDDDGDNTFFVWEAES
jgi:hypothetical protein